MVKLNDWKTPSLLEPESSGGDFAEGGFSFQECIVLSRIPMWLARDGFTEMLREGIFDAEAKFFVPGWKDFVLEAIEVKDKVLTPSEFWREIKRFQDVDDGSTGTYRWFTLVSTGLSENLHPLMNGLRRVRDPYSFYGEQSVVTSNSFDEYVKRVKKLGYTKEDSRFLFEKVLIEVNSSTAQTQAQFTQSLEHHLSEYSSLPLRTIGDMYANVFKLVRSRRCQSIARRELEDKLRERIDSQLLLADRPVRIYTSIGNDEEREDLGLRFEWESFFGGRDRKFPEPEIWNKQLVEELQRTKEWILHHRKIRRIQLVGNRRLSAAMAIGSVFSAVAGFPIEMEYREGKIWATDAYPTGRVHKYSVEHDFTEGSGEHVVVSIGIKRDIANDVKNSLSQHGLEESPQLHITAGEAIVSPEQANVAVKVVKDLISKTLTDTKSQQIHLFLASPSFFALFLGHCLNATATVQCYEWVSAGNYVPTCRLFSNES